MSLAARVAANLPLRTSSFLLRAAPANSAAAAAASSSASSVSGSTTSAFTSAPSGSPADALTGAACSLPFSRGRLSGALQNAAWRQTTTLNQTGHRSFASSSPSAAASSDRRQPLQPRISHRAGAGAPARQAQAMQMQMQAMQLQMQRQRQGRPSTPLSPSPSASMSKSMQSKSSQPSQRISAAAMRKPGYVPPPAPASASSATSIFDEELNRCTDGPAVLAVGSRTQLPLNEQDIRLFLDRLVKIPKVPRQGHDLHTVIKKVIATAEKSNLDLRVFVMLRFGDLKLRPGMVAAWPLVYPHLHELSASVLADVFWAASAIPKPLPEVVEQLEETSNILAPRLKEIPLEELPLSIYRCLYGLARSSRPGRCVEFRKKSQKLLLDKIFPTVKPGNSPWLPPQLVRLVWSLGRLGCRENIMYAKLEPLLRHVIHEFTERELEALYQIFTGLELLDQRRLIHDVERALQAREESRSGDPDKAPRRNQFRKKWTRANPLTHPVVKKPTHRR